MKRVVFIAGTAYSGSSMLDMMLGNSTSSFSMGEVKYLFEPTQDYHINPPCDCGDVSCNIWKELKKKGKKSFYSEVFTRYDNIKTIVDSSKDLFWVLEQRKNLSRLGIPSIVILIWKSPEEFALSRYKRNALKGWQRAWINYHKLFLSLNEQWWSVEYRDLATNPAETLKQICSALSLPYADHMENYWNKKHHMLFGNLSAKYHTFNKGEQKYKKTIDNLNRVEEKINDSVKNSEHRYRKIYYDSNFHNKIPESVIGSSQKCAFFNLISAIKSKNVNKHVENKVGDNLKDLFLSKSIIALLKVKKVTKEKKFRFLNSIKK